jgi:hypothetical protein
MSNLGVIEKKQLENLFSMGGGYVLNFSNRSFDEFVFDTTKININDEKFSVRGTSKANRLRNFWALESDAIVGKLIFTLCQYAENFSKPTPTGLKAGYEIAQRLMQGHTQSPAKEISPQDFLSQKFPKVDFHQLPIESTFAPVMEARYIEVDKCISGGAYLAAVILLGSLLEGVLLGVANRNNSLFNQAREAPKDKDGNVKRFPEWSLSNLIDVAHGTGFLNLDVKKFSHGLRDFRNYIHPYQQSMSQFFPDQDTTQICLQVFRAAMNQIVSSKNQSR